MAAPPENPKAGVAAASSRPDLNPIDDATADSVRMPKSASRSGGESSDSSDAVDEEEVQSVLGLSISAAQQRLTHPDTPAAEKAAALGDGDGDSFGVVGGAQDVKSSDAGKREASGMLVDEAHARSSSEPTVIPSGDRRVPSQTAERAPPRRDAQTRASLAQGFEDSRRRNSWGSSAQDAFRKMIPSSLPTFPKLPQSFSNFSIPTSPFSSTSSSSSEPKRKSLAGLGRREKSHSLSFVPEGWVKNVNPIWRSAVDKASIERGQLQSLEQTQILKYQDLRASPPPLDSPATTGGESPRRTSTTRSLRRSRSDESFMLNRALSRASSLGDDSRFAHVQEQVNSRAKAIKDSFQDTNFRLPAMPNISQFGFGNIKLDNISAKYTPSALREFPIFESRKASLRRTNPREFSRVSELKATAAGQDSPADPAKIVNGISAATHPHFSRALRHLTGDVVVLGGYRGSILRSAEPPHRQLWVPIKVGLNLRKVNLEVGLELEDEENMEDTIIPGGMLTHIGPVDISRRLLKRLRGCHNAQTGLLRVHEFGYDWRLSPHLLSRRLQAFLEKLQCNQPGMPTEKRGATVIAHSLGGLITRHVCNRKPDLFAGIVFAAVPQTCVNILGPLRNGDDVLLSSKILTPQVNFTIRTSFALLPLDGRCFINQDTREEYPVDFFDPQTWVDHCLSPCVACPLPPPVPAIPSLGFGTFIGSVVSALPNFPTLSRKSSVVGKTPPKLNGLLNSADHKTAGEAVTAPAVSHLVKAGEVIAETHGGAPHIGDPAAAATAATAAKDCPSEPSTTTTTTAKRNSWPPSLTIPSTTTAVSTIPHDVALAYLARTLASIKRFKQELSHQPAHTAHNVYPPLSAIYGKSTPTVYGARVASRAAIKQSDAFDNLVFASGDGVVLARAAMLPEGYRAVRGGVVASERGHVGLLGDLEAVGRCLNALAIGRRNGVGKG